MAKKKAAPKKAKEEVVEEVAVEETVEEVVEETVEEEKPSEVEPEAEAPAPAKEVPAGDEMAKMIRYYRANRGLSVAKARIAAEKALSAKK